MGDALLENVMFGIFGLLLGCGALAALGAAAAHRRRAGAVARTALTPLARCAGQRVKVQGTVDEPAEPIVSPLDGVRCAWIDLTVRATRGAGSSHEERELAALRRGDDLSFRDDSGRGLVDLRASTLELAALVERKWPELAKLDVAAVRALIGPDLERLEKVLDGFAVEYTERRILPGEPLHVTGRGVPCSPEVGRTAYRGAFPLVRFAADGDDPVIVARAKKEALIAHHRKSGCTAALVGALCGGLSAFLLWAWLFWQPFLP